MIDSLDAMDEGDETLLAEVIAHMESLKKARERKFQSRSEAARYAAQIRWAKNNPAETDGRRRKELTVISPRTEKTNSRGVRTVEATYEYTTPGGTKVTLEAMGSIEPDRDPPPWAKDMPERWQPGFEKRPQRITVRAFVGGEKVGYIEADETKNNFGSINETVGIPTGQVRISFVAVGDSRKRQGIATALLTAAETMTLDGRKVVHSTSLSDDGAGFASAVKARERKFSTRSEAARYAAQIRWGNRGATADATAGDGYHLALPVTFDKSEAILTGRPYGPLMEENFPPELKEMGAKVEALGWSDEKAEDRQMRAEYETALTVYFMGQLGASDLTPEAQEALKQWGEKSGVYRGIPPRTAEEGIRFAEQRAELATQMAQEQVKKVVERSYIREKIGTDEAMKYTKDIIHGGPEARITVAVDGPALVAIMSSGSLTTQFETGTTNGALNRTMRAGHEAVAYGTHPLADPRKRPIYGGYHPDGIRTPEADLSYQYGDFQLVMKREVTARATVSVSDSLGSVRNANPATGAVRPQAHPLGWKPDNPMAPQNMRTRIREGKRTQYAESQIHGGVSLKDVSHVAVAAGARIPASVEARLESLGIPVIRHSRVSREWKGDEVSQFPLADDSKVAKSLRLDMTKFLNDAIEKARERKFQSRSEAARYAANIRWANRQAQQAGGDDGIAALRAEADAIRSELDAIAATVDFSQPPPIGDPSTGYNWHDGPDSPPIIVDQRSGEVVPSPRVCDLHDRLLVVGEEINARVDKKRKGEGSAEDQLKEEAELMQAEVGALRPLGGTMFAPEMVFVGGTRRSDGTVINPEGVEREQQALQALNQASRVMPTDWMASANTNPTNVDFLPGNNTGSFTPPSAGGNSEIILPDQTAINRRTFDGSKTLAGIAAHELVHAVEFTRPSLRLMEISFMAHRTVGKPRQGFERQTFTPAKGSLKDRLRADSHPPRDLGQLSGGGAVTLFTDQFGNLYSGRMYDRAGVRNQARTFLFFETTSTGMEAYFGGNRTGIDRDQMNFVLGALVSA